MGRCLQGQEGSPKSVDDIEGDRLIVAIVFFRRREKTNVGYPRTEKNSIASGGGTVRIDC